MLLYQDISDKGGLDQTWASNWTSEGMRDVVDLQELFVDYLLTL